jgi:hypothetical protein
LKGKTAKTIVIASASEAIHAAAKRKNGLLRRFAPLRKRFAFVAGNDEKRHNCTISPRIPREFWPARSALSIERAQGMPGARCAR